VGVHVDEIHTNVVPPVAPVDPPGQQPPPDRLDLAEATWREAQRATAMTARRTAAEGFDD
jgi:hypothetical protein